MMKSFLAALFVSAALTGTASAATTVYSTETAFATAVGMAAGGPLQTEDFSGEPVTSPDNSLAGTRDFGGFTTTLVGTVDGEFNTVRSGGVFNSTGLFGEHLHVALAGRRHTLTITFKSAVIAFGGLFAGVNDGGIRSRLLIDGVLFDEWLGRTRQTNVGGLTRFFGIVSSTPFTQITFRGRVAADGFGEGFGIDNVQWAAAPTPVPVPASGLLLMGAMLVAGVFGRRRARA